MLKSDIIEAVKGFSKDLDTMGLEPQFKRGMLYRLCKRLSLTKSQIEKLLGEEKPIDDNTVKDWSLDDRVTTP